jgi:hypothetical protein
MSKKGNNSKSENTKFPKLAILSPVLVFLSWPTIFALNKFASIPEKLLAYPFHFVVLVGFIIGILSCKDIWKVKRKMTGVEIIVVISVVFATFLGGCWVTLMFFAFCSGR